MCKTNALDKKGNQHGICKRNSPDKKSKKKKKKKNQKKKACTGCLRETPKIAIKTARDM